MTALLLRRRAITAAAGWNPSQITSAVAYWNAGDLPVASNGSPVGSWADRIAGITLAPGASAPTYVTSSGATGKPAVRFTAASSQYMTAPAGVLPTQGPLWVWTVHRTVTLTGQIVWCECAVPGNPAAGGWAAEYNSGAAPPGFGIVAWFVLEATTGSGETTGDPVWRTWAWDPVTAKTFLADRDDLAYASSAAMASQATAGATTFTLGGSRAQGRFYLDAEVQAVIIGTGAGPSAADQWNMAIWVYGNYGIFAGQRWNAPASVNVATVTSTGTQVHDAAELGVIYNPAGVAGHKYWAVFSPFDNGSVDENPCINFSDDGNTWAATGITNPIVAYPGGGAAGNNADGALLDNSARDGTLYCYYARENATTNGVRVASSTTGTTWTDQGFILTGAASRFECPVCCHDSVSGQYWLYTMDLASTPHTVWRAASSTPSGPWSAQSQCTFTGLPSGDTPWHVGQPVLIGSRWVLPFSQGYPGAAMNLWLASSGDGLTWTTSHPLMVPGVTNWDAGWLYRPAIQDAGDGTNLLLWYTAGPSGSNSNDHCSQMVTVPYSEIP